MTKLRTLIEQIFGWRIEADLGWFGLGFGCGLLVGIMVVLIK